jgi:hypothetical protein
VVSTHHRKALDSKAETPARRTRIADHIDHASQKAKQKQTVDGPKNVIGPKSRPITSITPAKKRNENKHMKNRVVIAAAGFLPKPAVFSSKNANLRRKWTICRPHPGVLTLSAPHILSAWRGAAWRPPFSLPNDKP